MMDTLEITWQMESVTTGTDSSAYNPLARATYCLLQNGQPLPRLTKCFFRGTDGTVRWLGVFVHSAGNRIIFFPGFSEPQTYIKAYTGDALKWDESFQIDHISLEKDRLSWHFTEPKSANQRGKMFTTVLGPNIVHWFSMSVSSQEDLRTTLENTVVTAQVAPSDIDRRMEGFINARDGALFQLIELNKEQPPHSSPSFLHFSVLVGPSGFQSPTTDILGAPDSTPLQNTSLGRLSNVPTRIHRVSLSSEVDIEVISALLPGELKMSYVFTGKSSRSSS